jgi:hypothetical protein
METPSTIALTANDWRRAAWRRLPPLPRPEALQFDLERCVKQVEWYLPNVAVWRWDQDHAFWRTTIRVSLSREEALFWLMVLRERDDRTPSREFANSLSARWAELGKLDEEAIRGILKSRPVLVPQEAAILLAHLMPIADVVALIVEADLGDDKARLRLAQGFIKFVLPHLEEADGEKLREYLRPRVAPDCWPTRSAPHAPVVFLLTAALGMPDEMLRLVQNWPDRMRRPATPGPGHRTPRQRGGHRFWPEQCRTGDGALSAAGVVTGSAALPVSHHQ